MIIGLIISLLSVTYTVLSSNQVAVTGDPPKGTEVVYSRSSTTGKNGQMTRGNSTNLVLSGWDACRIDSVVLRMHSNTSQGAGRLLMQIGDRTVWEIADNDFSHESWCGRFSTSWVDISHSVGAEVGYAEDIALYIEASENSLYIDSYTFYYTLPEVAAHRVCLLSGLGGDTLCLTEDSIASGVVLPMGVDTLGWRFVGWSEKALKDTSHCAMVYGAGSRYFPVCDCRLWAVYADADGAIACSHGVSGAYAIVHTGDYWSAAMHGVVSNGEVPTSPVALKEHADGGYELLTSVSENMVYDIDFLSDSTLTIQHVSSGEMVGYSGTKLASIGSVWRYDLLGDSTYAIYYQDRHLYRMLRFGNMGSNELPEVVAYACRVEMDLLTHGGMLLFPFIERRFTSWPLGRLDEEEEEDKNETVETTGVFLMRFGAYVLQVKDGVKQLIIGN